MLDKKMVSGRTQTAGLSSEEKMRIEFFHQ